ncbi:MAG TPA: ABC transporter permease, partial [Vicinamibacterales bacterium]|nr:ABC transporter permease [Vicinamibacterales bacterium]
MSALRGLLIKEVFHILRDRRTLVVVVMLPVVQVIVFGAAIRTDVRNVRLAVVDSAPDDQTIAVRNRFAATDVFTIVAVVPHAADLEPLFQAGRAQEAIVFEPGFAEDVVRGRPARLGIVTDAVEPNTGSLLQAYALGVVQTIARERVGPGRPAVSIAPEVRLRFNPTRESSHLFVPGLMAFVLTIISSLMTAVSLTREKETGTLEALLVSPLRPWQIIVGKVAPYLGIGFLSVLLILVEARTIFGVPLRGSVVLLLAEAVLFILVSLSLG